MIGSRDHLTPLAAGDPETPSWKPAAGLYHDAANSVDESVGTLQLLQLPLPDGGKGVNRRTPTERGLRRRHLCTGPTTRKCKGRSTSCSAREACRRSSSFIDNTELTSSRTHAMFHKSDQRTRTTPGGGQARASRTRHGPCSPHDSNSRSP